jgi:hypothetical protein
MSEDRRIELGHERQNEEGMRVINRDCETEWRDWRFYAIEIMSGLGRDKESRGKGNAVMCI